MYAIIESGGKQMRVVKGDVINVELLGVEDGSQVEFDNVLFVGGGEKSGEKLVGNPFVQGYKVKGKVIGTELGEKVIAYKFKRRKNNHCKQGHRQKYTSVEINEIAS